MPPDSPIYDKRAASGNGVGAALHLTPAGIVRDGRADLTRALHLAHDTNTVLCTRAELSVVSAYDAKVTSWRKMLAVLDSLDNNRDCELDWSDGERWPRSESSRRWRARLRGGGLRWHHVL